MLVFTVEEPHRTLFGKEPIYCDDRLVGATTSAAFGYTIGKPVALGYVAAEPGQDPSDLALQSYHIDIAGERVAAVASLTPPYDPERHRLRS
jgi:4-methylaminobutanoate oxidase (formaldehyde-forming)